MALDGIRRVFRYLPPATDEGSNLEARMQMMIAAFEGGVAISKGLGPAHAIAISCGDQGLHHGMLSAIGVLASLPLLERQIRDRVRPVADAMGLEVGQSTADGVQGSYGSRGSVDQPFRHWLQHRGCRRACGQSRGEVISI